VAKKPQTKYELKRRKLLKLYFKQKRERMAEINQRMEDPSARRAARLSWQRHVESTLLWAKNGYDDGHDMAFWDAVLFCEQTQTPKPAWVRDALEKNAKDRINGVPVKQKGGRPINWMRDAYILTSVDWWREESRVLGRKRKPRYFSINEACKKVKEELAGEGVNLEVPTIRTAYDHAKKRFSSGSYRGSPFLN
jgi:hypothetical protein